MKKRIFAVLFAMMMLAGCGGGEAAEETGTAAAQEEQMLAELKEVPADITVEDAAAKGFFTIADGAVAGGQENWDAFVAACEEGETASIMICQSTQKDGVVLDNLYYDGEIGAYTVISDTTRDGYDDEKSIVKDAATYTDLKVFENFSLQEGGTEYTVCVLSNEAELTADDFRTYWIEMSTEAHQVYMLYVI